METPLGEAGLESVVTADATLLVRNRRVDGAEHELAIDVQQLRPGFCVRGRCKGLDGLRHLAIGWRRHDRAPDATDPAEAKLGAIAVLLVEGFDGMGPERRRHRRG